MGSANDAGELMVSIRCATYNHEPYIRQCLDGFVMQKTNFRFEAIVHDDASTDGTAAIVREYAEKYPDLIKPIYETENQYSKHDGSLSRIMNAHTRGKYVAMCEGDDYWTDPLKLQKQVDFLEGHPEYGMCHTDSYILLQSSGRIKPMRRPCVIEGDATEELLLGNSCIATLTVLYRKELLSQIDYGYLSENFKMGDLPLWIEMSRLLKIGYLSDKTAVYRVLENSASHSEDILKQLLFDLSGYEARLYFIKKYGYASLEKIIRQKKNDLLAKIFLCLGEHKKSIVMLCRGTMSIRSILSYIKFSMRKSMAFRN